MSEETRAAAYVPYGTFKNQLDRFQKGGLPGRVDKSAFVGLAGGTQTQLLATMKFLNLVTEEDELPTEALKQLVARDEVQRRPILKKVLQEAYPKLFELDLASATPQMVDEAMANYGVAGSTLTKAVRFFLTAAAEVGIELSTYLQKSQGGARPKGNGAPRRKRAKATPKQQPSQDSGNQVGGTSKQLQLVSGGGSVTLTYSVNLFEASPEDRDFVLQLIKSLEDYERKHPPEPRHSREPKPAPDVEEGDEERGDQE